MGENAEIDLYEDFNEQHENVRKLEFGILPV